jgi:hypothetical protein
MVALPNSCAEEELTALPVGGPGDGGGARLILGLDRRGHGVGDDLGHGVAAADLAGAGPGE